jgi:TolA-binding protein
MISHAFTLYRPYYRGALLWPAPLCSSAVRTCKRCGAWLAIVSLSLFSAAAQLGDEQVLFEAATRSLQIGAFERAEQEFADFVRSFPTSPHVAEAILYQARAALQQQKFEIAIDLLTTNAARAGVITDRYRYWVGETYFRSSNYVTAAETFARMIRDFPDSARLLSAAHGEAWAHFRLREYHKAIDLLQDPEGAFQRAAYERRTDVLAIRGQLLLAEAHLELGDDLGAERAIARLADRRLTPELEWRRDYVLCRIELLRKRYPAALALATNLQATAVATDQPLLKVAEAVALHGSILEQAGDASAAVQVYTNNLTTVIPAGHRRAAFLRMIELTLAQNRLTEAAQQLEQFFAQYPGDAGSDVALLTLGELHLKRHSLVVEASGANSNQAMSSNHLHEALSRFDRLRSGFPQSPLLGQAHLNRGWCYWEQGNIPESQAAFKLALEHLPSAELLAVAHFKLGDTRFRQGEYTNAINDYRQALREVAAAPALRDELSAQALYQILRATLAMGSLREAEETMTRLLAEFPDDLYGQRGLLLVGHGLMRAAQPAEARALFEAFLEKAKDPALRAQVELAIARSHAEEKQWDMAARHYTTWLDRYATNTIRPQVEFDRAWVHYLGGDETNAFRLFTNFVARFPTNVLSARAQLWIADYHLRQGNYSNAEIAYQAAELINSTNVHHARMMAGRAAFARQAYKNAHDYFTALVNDDNCPPEIAAEAFFALGDTILLEDSDPANPIQKFDEAREAFRRIPQRYPTSRLVPLAWGQIGNCYFQMATIDSRYYTNALDSYFRVLTATNEAGVVARSQAEFGIGQVFEKQAKGPPERPDLLRAALDHYLNIFNGKNLRTAEVADPFWARESGLAAARLAEEGKQWELALNIYVGLRELAPASRDSLERKITRLRQQLGEEKS